MRSRLCGALIPMAAGMLLWSGTAPAVGGNDVSPSTKTPVTTQAREAKIAAAGASYALPATGQTTCWNSSGIVVSCTGTGQDGELRAGATLAYVDNGDGTITDSNTGLMWEKLSDDGTIHDWKNMYAWDNAFVVKIATLNGGGGFAGHTDWRVPNIKELQSIVNYELPYPGPMVTTAFNTGCSAPCAVTACSCTQSHYYWSSSSNASNPNNAFVVHFNNGYEDASSKTNLSYVRAVRGGS